MNVIRLDDYRPRPYRELKTIARLVILIALITIILA